HAVNRRTEIEPQRLAARSALNLHEVRRHLEAAWEGSVIELQNEIAAAAVVWRYRAGDVVSPVLIGRRCQPSSCYHTYAGQAFLAVVLQAVAIGVVENLADHVGAIERGIGYKAHGGGCFAGY